MGPVEDAGARCKVHIQMQVQIQARFDTHILGIQTKLSSRSINLQTPEDPVALATPTRTRLLPSICSLCSLCFASQL